MINMPKKRSNVPSNETPAAKFMRLANQRVSRFMKVYKQLGALGGSAYQSTPDQLKKINDALINSHQHAMDSLNRKAVATQEFKL